MKCDDFRMSVLKYRRCDFLIGQAVQLRIILNYDLLFLMGHDVPLKDFSNGTDCSVKNL